MKTYTKTGDQGESGLFSGQRVKKTHPRIVSCGTLDELNSHLGLAMTAHPAQEVTRALALLQPLIFELGTDLASLSKSPQATRITAEEVGYLEKEIDAMEAALPVLKSFIIPGGSPCAAHLHVARTVCRRAEREVVEASQTEEIAESDCIFINRLSDYLFVLSRYENFLAGYVETEWKPKG